MEDLADKQRRWGIIMTHCPPVDTLKTSSFMGIPLGDMTQDQLIQVAWFLSRGGATRLAMP